MVVTKSCRERGKKQTNKETDNKEGGPTTVLNKRMQHKTDKQNTDKKPDITMRVPLLLQNATIKSQKKGRGICITVKEERANESNPHFQTKSRGISINVIE
jgi:hypothetical protein